MTENNEHLALWGGRFTSGPSPELARLSKSTQFAWPTTISPVPAPTPVLSAVRDF